MTWLQPGDGFLEINVVLARMGKGSLSKCRFKLARNCLGRIRQQKSLKVEHPFCFYVISASFEQFPVRAA